jgi:TolB-like protein/Flp pilus assembly protein TadD
LGTAAASIAGIGVGGWALFKPTAAAASDSIAVLPFENLSGDPRESYFSDGVAEEIRSSLMRIGGLKVVGRTSSEAVRNDDAATVARKLDVANILTGSVRQSPSTIRVTAELVDGRSGIDRWSQDYDRPPGDTIKIQTDIAENVAGALSEALGRAARAAISVGGTQNVQAQRLFIQAGAVAAGMVSKQEFQRAFQLLDSAISLDPNYAAAYALKSRKLMMYSNNYANGSELARDRAESLRLARIALKLAPNLASAHQALGDYYSSTLQIAPGIAEFDRALRLAPADADVLTYYSLFRSEIGDANGALELVNRAIALDPLNQEPYQHRLIALFNARRFEDVVSEGEQLQRKSPELFGSAMTLADSLVMLGRFPEAERFYATADADFWHRLTGEAVLLARAGDKSGARRKLQRLQQVYGGAASTQYAEIYAQLGDVDQAFAALDAAYSIKDGGLQGLRVDPFLDPLRSDPRFQAIVRRMNFPT